MRDGGQARQLFAFDAARALAAFAVVAAHARTMMFDDGSRQATLPWFGRAFFAVTGLGHQAVIVFFVISGALVTRSILDLEPGAAPAWRPFAANRIVRLWTVLLPCLILGGLADRLGLMKTDPARFYGAPDISAASVGQHLALTDFGANLLFLQGRVIPFFGSNAPLWTLSLEAWCYALGFALFAFRSCATWLRAAAIIALGCAITLLFGWIFWQLFPIWLMGSALAVWMARARPGPEQRLSGWAGLTGVVLALIGTRLLPARLELLGAYGLALASVFALARWRDWTPARQALRAAVRAASAFSYSLYLGHFPLLALVSAAMLGQCRISFGLGGVGVWFAAVLLAIAQAGLLWWLFERHTGRIRRAATRLILRRDATPAFGNGTP